MDFIGIIPARYASSRFPGKPLALLGGRPVVEWVYERAASVLPRVAVATDDARIARAVEQFGGCAVMTRTDHQSGTDRVAEAVEKLGAEADVVVNIQGDEPFIAGSQIEALMQLFGDGQTQIGTMAKPFDTIEQAESPHSPKVVTDACGFALYFSRSVIPFVRGRERSCWLGAFPFLKHLGLYAYRREVLRAITRLPQSPLELAEGLEQLRWLQNGYRIKVALTSEDTVGIDTPEDLARAELRLRSTTPPHTVR